MTKRMEETISSLSSILCLSWKHFFPTVRVDFFFLLFFFMLTEAQQD